MCPLGARTSFSPAHMPSCLPAYLPAWPESTAHDGPRFPTLHHRGPLAFDLQLITKSDQPHPTTASHLQPAIYTHRPGPCKHSHETYPSSLPSIPHHSPPSHPIPSLPSLLSPTFPPSCHLRQPHLTSSMMQMPSSCPSSSTSTSSMKVRVICRHIVHGRVRIVAERCLCGVVGGCVGI